MPLRPRDDATDRATRTLPSGVLALALCLLAGACGTGEEPAKNVVSLPDSAFRVEWKGVEVARAMKPEQRALATVTFKNLSPVTWPDPKSPGALPTGAGAVRLSYRWWTAGSPLPSDYSDRADLSAPVRPGDTATVTIPVRAPAKAGEYELQIDLVQELVTWFEAKGAPALRVPVSVR
ncbi:MAG: hypothetical protein ACRD16_05835 [Thermoanaerobaculia bacterium]